MALRAALAGLQYGPCCSKGGAKRGQACASPARNQAPSKRFCSISIMPETQPEHAPVQILMSTYNGAHWIEAQLESFLAQSHLYWQLWVSDDGSSDTTRDILRAFDARNPGKLVAVLEGPGKGSAANFMHLLCHDALPSGIVALSDQDDVWHPHKLKRAVSALQRAGPAPCVWSARYRITDARQRPLWGSPVWTRGPSLGNALVQNILSGHTLTLNAAALAQVRAAGPQDVPFHDWWIYLLMMATGARALVDSEIVLDYRQHGGNVIGQRGSARARASRMNALLRGTLQDWIAQNLQALAQANALPLTREAETLLQNWPGGRALQRIGLMRAFDIHRQSRHETVLLYLSAAMGRI